MEKVPATGRRVTVVIDVETRLDEAGAATAAYGPAVDGRALFRKQALHRVVSAAYAVAVVEGLRMVDFGLGSWSIADQTEADVLCGLDDTISDALTRASDREIVTYGGSLHDIPVLRRRTMAHWLFSRRRLAFAEGFTHVDLMTDRSGDEGRWASLRDECAALGIPLRAQEAGAPLERARAKCEADVCATFLLHLHRNALDAGVLTGLASGWVGLARYLQTHHRGASHLAPYRTHGHIAIAEEHLARLA